MRIERLLARPSFNVLRFSSTTATCQLSCVYLQCSHEPHQNFQVSHLSRGARPISMFSWRPRMLNRRMLILSAGKAAVLMPATAASHDFSKHQARMTMAVPATQHPGRLRMKCAARHCVSVARHLHASIPDLKIRIAPALTLE